MIYKDIQSKYGFMFVFQSDMNNDNVIPYVVINPNAHINSFSAIANMKNGEVRSFGEYDGILNDEVIELQMKGFALILV